MISFTDIALLGADAGDVISGVASAMGASWKVTYIRREAPGNAAIDRRVVLLGIDCTTESGLYDTECGEILRGVVEEMRCPSPSANWICAVSGTSLQKDVWKTLASLKWGETVTYSELAVRAGHPSAVRAVASAVGRNPVSLLLPCHRVVPADRSKFPGRYTGGDHVKAVLLKAENVDKAD